MQTYNQLRRLGYNIEFDHDTGCTVVTHDQYFFYYNPEFCKSLFEINVSIDTTCFDGVKKLIVAGIPFASHEDFPFILLNKKEEAKLRQYYEDIDDCWKIINEAREKVDAITAAGDEFIKGF